MRDVARRAGVSLGTVSHVLNHPALVRPATRFRVESAIQELGYVRNESARQLRAGSSRMLAYLALDATNPYFTDVAGGAEARAREFGLALFLCSSAGSPARESDYLDLLMEQRVRGVLVTPADDNNPRLAALRDRGVAVVLVGRAPGQGDDFCEVGVDDVEGGELAGEHLIEQGHELIAFAGAVDHYPQVRDRLAGLRKAIAAAGHGEDGLSVLRTGELTVEAGRQVAERILGTPVTRRPTAVFCANDLMALGLLQGLTQRGVPVPGEIAIVGYDDIYYAGAAAVPLSSVSQPRQRLGRTAVELLIAESDESGPDHEHRQITVRPELVVRDSSASARTARREGRTSRTAAR